ncbi:TorD/DmsD family molecular chaperone [Azospirillum halopraeferens]|uniref:TorD/DmsD family molecular chaperone n=1 Tax=Azospirillum halopraeferens TaxID=34010 RepID=UPI000417A68A|nr:molecular chaperone TorD family protein [Azospirillum halopraeferens]
MAVAPDETAAEAADHVERERAQAYRLLAALLARPPDGGLLDRLATLHGDGSPFGTALGALGGAAAATAPAAAEREFNRLFIGVDRGELVPYASYYRTGFLQDRPLIRLRADLDRLGIARAAGVPEPEDHVAALAETMAGLIDGGFGAPAPLDRQFRFFDDHIAPWGARFFADLERAPSAVFYRPVGTLGRLFLEIEAGAFAPGAA